MMSRDLSLDRWVKPSRVSIAAALAIGTALALAGYLVLSREWSQTRATWNPLALGPFTWLSQVFCVGVAILLTSERKLLQQLDLEVVAAGAGFDGLGLTARQSLQVLFDHNEQLTWDEQDRRVRSLCRGWETAIAGRVWSLWLWLAAIPVLAAFDAIAWLGSPEAAATSAACLAGIWLGTVETAALGYWLMHLGQRWQHRLETFDRDWSARMQVARDELASDAADFELRPPAGAQTQLEYDVPPAAPDDEVYTPVIAPGEEDDVDPVPSAGAWMEDDSITLDPPELKGALAGAQHELTTHDADCPRPS